MKQKRFLPLMAVALATSCIDNSYDLSDIDATIGSEVNITLPSCSTGDIFLRNIMDLEEDGIIQVVPNPNGENDSIFVVKQDGKANIEPVRINTISMTAPTVNSFEATVERHDLLSIAKAPARANKAKRITIKVQGQDINLEDKSYYYDIKPEDTHQDFEDGFATNISTDVTSIQRISYDEVTIAFELTIQLPKEYTCVPKIHADNLRLNLPTDLIVKSCVIDGVPAVSINNEEGYILLTQNDEKGFAIGKPLKLEVKSEMSKTGKDFVFYPERHELELKGSFEVLGSIRVETADMDPVSTAIAINNDFKNLTPQEQSDLLNNGKLNFTHIKGLIPKSITFKGDTKFNNHFDITAIEGTFQHEIEKIDPIKLNDLPIFLTDDEVMLDLDNPMIVLTIKCMPKKASNHSDATLSTVLTLSCDNGVSKPEGYSTKVETKVGEETIIVMADNDNFRYLDATYKNAQKRVIDGLADLIKKIPKEIKVDMTAVDIMAKDLDLTDQYDIDINYDIFAPLAFGDEFKLVYSDTERDLDLDDLEDMDFECLIVEAKAFSSLPAKVMCSVTPIDANGMEIKALEKLEVTVDANAKEQPIRLVLAPLQGHTISDLINGRNGVHKMDGIKYRAEIAEPINADAVPGNARLKLKDVKVTLKGKVTYDAN